MRHLAITLFVTVIGTALFRPAIHAAPPEPDPNPEGTKQQPRVYVGVYLSDISDFDLTKGRFNAEPCDMDNWIWWLGF